MKKYLLSFLLIVFVLLGGGFYLLTLPQSNLLSPILGISKTVKAENLWFPEEKDLPSFADAPEITAQAAFFVDTQTGKVLYQKNSHQRLSIASLTKIMTVIVTLENKDLDDLMEVTQREADMEPDKMELKAGEKLTVEELLDGIFLVSANDGAEVLADNSVGSRDEFIKQMNVKALELGMKDTKFLNPTGLEEDFDKQYSTAFDVALMSRYAITHRPNLVEISSQPVIILPESSVHQEYGLNNGINLLTTYPGVVGFKTGYTPEAGLTLVTLARREGHEVLGVLLNSTDRRDDARYLLDYSFGKLGVRP